MRRVSRRELSDNKFANISSRTSYLGASIRAKFVSLRVKRKGGREGGWEKRQGGRKGERGEREREKEIMDALGTGECDDAKGKRETEE